MTKQDTALTVEADGRAMIPLFRLKKSEKNVRKVPHSAASIEALAASIRVRGIMQNLVVEPEFDADNKPTGYYLVTAGEGRRMAQMARLAAKEIKKTEPLPCLIDTVNDARETSLDENISREAMHPADQFEAFKTLADERGYSDEDIAARFGVTAQLVRKRLKLGSLSPRLMALYRADELKLEQMMAFTLTDDHARQEQVYDQLSPNNLYANSIRNCLTETQMRASDRIAKYLGEEEFKAAGGVVTGDLFSEDVFFADKGMVERLALEKLKQAATDLQNVEGWKWVEAAFSYAHPEGTERFYPQEMALDDTDTAAWNAVMAEYDALTNEWEGADEMPQTVQDRLTVLDGQIEVLDARRMRFDPEDVARGGIVLSLSYDGTLRIERGFIRAEDKALKVATATEEDTDALSPDQDEEAPLPALSDSLLRDITAHRTVATRLVLGENADAALIVATHALVLQLFYGTNDAHCIELRGISTGQQNSAPGIDDTDTAHALRDRHDQLAAGLPEDGADLWDYLAALSPADRMALFAHCIAMTVNVTRLPHDRRTKAASAELATAIKLDMSQHWEPTVESYFGRVSKKQILADVTEAKGPDEAIQISTYKKGDMAHSASNLVKDTGWLPAALRTI